ncbi:GOLPH3/VPS74 family protein [Streptomyces bohaiensis]|uniref:GPP34 family phosphoprotein n=1 Tax=Streptomyces bohaiensis TaxID=1431344 RepID=A0ABX1CC56_9ACTN|nr:GPP34 family phosphoprotein [Streptomyces bohaiensis]NJQ16694.1 GPP34 family phosphoprotein [Streptomyces bohaiensis]
MSRSRRTIPEELLLLALDPATGTTAQPQSLDLGLAGAQLVELALAGRIAPDGDRIAVVLARPTGDPTLDTALELLRRRGSPVRAVHWIGGPRLGLRQTYLTHLERCGMVQAIENHMCGVLPTTRYQASDNIVSRQIRHRLDTAIRTGAPPDPRTAALASLAHAVGLGKHLYPGNEGRSSRSRLRDLIRHDPMGGLVAHAVMEVQNGAAGQAKRAAAPSRGRGQAPRAAAVPAQGPEQAAPRHAERSHPRELARVTRSAVTAR